MTSDRIGALAEVLGDAWANAHAVDAPSRSDPALTVEDAYEIQDLMIEARLSQGRRRAGWKLGLTSAKPPATPIVGTLLDDMVIPSGSDLSASTMVAPMVEAEVVVRIGEDIVRPMTAAELATGPHQVGPGIEVIDYRTTGSTGVIDWVADNSTVAYAVVGSLSPIAGFRPEHVGATISKNGEVLASGRADLIMGNPIAAVAWLSGHLSARGRTLTAGDVILTGSLTGHHRVPADVTEFTADFGGFGAVSVGFHR